MKSKLKTLIQEIFKVKRNGISFVVDDDDEFPIFQIKADNDNIIFSLSSNSDKFCCGLLPLGNTIYNTDDLIAEADINIKNEFYVLCMNQIHKLAVNEVKEGRLSTGLATWTHTNDNDVVIALQSEYNTENMPWKLVNTFFNPNSQNTVCLFTSNLNV